MAPPPLVSHSAWLTALVAGSPRVTGAGRHPSPAPFPRVTPRGWLRGRSVRVRPCHDGHSGLLKPLSHPIRVSLLDPSLALSARHVICGSRIDGNGQRMLFRNQLTFIPGFYRSLNNSQFLQIPNRHLAIHPVKKKCFLGNPRWTATWFDEDLNKAPKITCKTFAKSLLTFLCCHRCGFICNEN